MDIFTAAQSIPIVQVQDGASATKLIVRRKFCILSFFSVLFLFRRLREHMRKFIVAAALLALLPVYSQAKTLEQLLAEKGVITKAEANSVSTAEPAKVYWNDGTRIEFPDSGFKVKISTFLQAGYGFTDSPDGAQNVSSFDVNNARIELSGTALHEEFAYNLEYDGESNHLKKAYLQWNACDYGYARVGQFKTAISRQFNNSNWKLMFADRSFASNYFDFGYQKGARAEGKLMDGQIIVGGTLTNGISDGEGEYASGVDTKHIISADLRWNAVGKMDVFEEGDINMTQDPALSIGAAYAYSDSNNVINEYPDKVGINRTNVDVNFKYNGLGINAEYYISDESPDFAEESTTQGAYLQAGYFVMPKQLEVAGRWSYVNCDHGKGSGQCLGLKDIQGATAG
ncbi:MAG: hypothetical protein GYA55_06215, partial [SAR324 cluster bacterium]|nr:hypothetical protein [SAR324 cluster bacterium]